MGLFSFSKPSDNAGDSNKEIQLIINSETINVPFEEAEGKTIQQVFARFANSVCDTNRINRFVSLGRIIAPSSVVEAGTVYSGSIASESKG